MTSTLEFLITAKDEASKVFNEIGDSVEKSKGKFDKFQAGANIAMAAVAVGAVEFAKKSVEAYSEHEDAQTKLAYAFQQFPALADTNVSSLNALNEELQKKTGYDRDATSAAEASLAQYGLTGAQITQLTPLIQDYAAKTGTDMATAADQVGKAMLGQGRALKGVGIDFTDTGSVAGNFQETVAGLTDKVGGFADTMGGTAAGKTKILGEQWKDLEATAGEKLLPALTKLTDAGIKLTDWMGGHQSETVALAAGIGTLGTVLAVAANWTSILAIKTGLLGIATSAWSVITKIATAGQWLWNAAEAAGMLPITLIVAGIALLVAGFLYLWNNNEGFRKFVISMWAGIQAVFKAVVDWVVNVMVPFLVAAFNNIAKVVGTVVAWITNAWNEYWRGMSLIAGWIGDAVGRIVGFFTNMPGQISRAASGMWDGIVTAFKSAINTLIRLWNGFHLTIGGGTFAGVAIPSMTLTPPQVPYLASGGSIAQGGAAVVGERGAELVTLQGGSHVTGSGATVSLSDATLTALAQLVGDRIVAGTRGAIATNQWGESMQRQSPPRGH